MMRNRRTGAVAVGGVMSAAALVLLLAASYLPGGRVGLTALAGVVGAVIVLRSGLRTGVLSYFAVALLALFLLPNKGIALLYAVFFGPYTIIKNLIERSRSRVVGWVLKYAFCLAVSVLLFRFSESVLGMIPPMLAERMWLLVPVIAAGFLAYDIVFTKLIGYFADRLPA